MKCDELSAMLLNDEENEIDLEFLIASDLM